MLMLSKATTQPKWTVELGYMTHSIDVQYHRLYRVILIYSTCRQKPSSRLIIAPLKALGRRIASDNWVLYLLSAYPCTLDVVIIRSYGQFAYTPLC